MYSAFSTSLLETYRLIMCAKTRSKFPLPEEPITQTLQKLCTTYGLKNSPEVMLGSSMISDELSQIEHEISYKIATSPALRKLLGWINKNIIEYYIMNGESSLKTVNVRVRIATGMLNNLFMDEVISEWMARLIHENFTENLQQLQADIRNDGLPF